MKANPFSVGQRVLFYHSRRLIGVIDNIVGSMVYVRVIEKEIKNLYIVHYKQCRRLKKKEWKEVTCHNLLNKKVRVYSQFVFDGTVNKVFETKRGLYLSVTEDGFYSAHNDSPFHIKQCEVLEDFNILILKEDIENLKKGNAVTAQVRIGTTNMSGGEVVEFVEVRK